MSYLSNYICVWSLVVLAFLVALVVGGLALLTQEPAAVAALVSASVALVACSFCVRTRHRRVIVRGGRFFFGGLKDASPRTIDELKDTVRRTYIATGEPPVVVGAGWGFFLKQHVPEGRRLFLHKFRGPLSEDKMRWKAGTTIYEVAAALAKLDPPLAFDSHPSLDMVSIGGAYAMGNHGNGGDLNGGFTRSMDLAVVLDMSSGETINLNREELRLLFDNPDKAATHVVVEVELSMNGLVTNTDIQKKLVWVDSIESAAEWLKPGAYLRVLFLGYARKRALGLLWHIPDGNHDHRDPHFGSRFCMSLQADVCSAMCNLCIESPVKWTGVIDRRNANRFSPTPPFLPSAYIALLLSGTRNYEIVFKYPEGGMTPIRLHTLVSSLYEMHRVTGGRSEIRVGGTSAASPIFLDVSMSRDFSKPFSVLKRLGVERVALHPGKMILDTAPLTRAPLAEMYNIRARI